MVISLAVAERVERSRTAQGLPARVTDDAVLVALARLLLAKPPQNADGAPAGQQEPRPVLVPPTAQREVTRAG